MASETHRTGYKYRSQLPSPSSLKKDANLWSILKNCIGKELSNITMPVEFNEPLSFLQRISEYMEYSFLLQKASDAEESVDRLQYVAAFAVSALAANWERLNKPFNPLLGETYEVSRNDIGFRIVCEQVNHHPPVSAFHADSETFRFYGSVHPKLKFWGKSIEIKPEGIFTIELLKHREIYTWSNVNCCVHNIIVGKLWFEQYGLMEITCHTTGLSAQINFKPAGWFCRDLHRIEGFILDGQKKKLLFLYGKWTDYLKSASIADYEEYLKADANKHRSGDAADDDNASSNLAITPKKMASRFNILTRPFSGGSASKSPSSPEPPPIEPESLEDEVPKSDSSLSLDIPNSTFLWQVDPRPDDSNKYYNFTLFAMTLNEISEDLRQIIPQTDCRLRPDIRKLEDGDTEGAAQEKNRLEEKQREARKQRKKKKEIWNPKWFKQGKVSHLKGDVWLFNGLYWDRDFGDCPDIF